MVTLREVDFDPFADEETASADASPKLSAKDGVLTALDQLMQGATFGFSDEIQDRIGAGIASLATGEKYDDVLKDARATSSKRLKSEAESLPEVAIPAQILGGLLTGGAGASTKAGTTLGNSLRAGGAGARIAKGAVAGAASGALYGAGSADEGNRLENAGQGALLGGIAGGAIPAAGAALGAAKNAILPSASGEIADIADMAMSKYGIPLRRSEIGDSRAAKTLASVTKDVPLSGATDFLKKQGKAFNKALAKTFGEDVERITPNVIDAAYKRIGGDFDKVLAGKTIKITDEIIDGLAAIDDEAFNSITDDTYRIVKNQTNKFLKDIGQDGTISGEKINSLRSNIGKILRRTNNDASPFLHDLQELVIDASVGGLPKAESEAARATLNRARLQYKNLKTVEPLAAKANRGYVNPALLQGEVMRKFKDYAQGGGGDLGELARIGQTLLKDTVPNSGTMQRGATLGALGVGGIFDPITAAKVIGGSKAFNLLDTAQPLVKGAVKAGSSVPPTSFRGESVLPVLEGNLAQYADDINPPAAVATEAVRAVPDVAPNLREVDFDPFADNALQSVTEPMSTTMSLPQDIRQDEGLRHAAYDDTTGNRTVGYGFNMDSGIGRKVWKRAGIDVPFDDVYEGKAVISDAHAEALGRESFKIAVDDATDLYSNFPKLSDSRKEALFNLSYQMGKTKLGGFKEFNAAVNKGNWTDAVRYLMKTKAAQQAPQRFRDNARKLLRG